MRENNVVKIEHLELLVSHYIYIKNPSKKFDNFKHIKNPLFNALTIHYFQMTLILNVGNNIFNNNKG